MDVTEEGVALLNMKEAIEGTLTVSDVEVENV